MRTTLLVLVRWRSKVNVTYWLLYPHGNMPQHLVDRSLGKPQSRSGYSEGKNLLSLLRIKPQYLSY